MRQPKYPLALYGTYPNLVLIESFRDTLKLEKEALGNGTNLDAC